MEESIIARAYIKYRGNALMLEKIIKQEEKMTIFKNKIHQVLKENGLADPDPRKEREGSGSNTKENAQWSCGTQTGQDSIGGS